MRLSSHRRGVRAHTAAQSSGRSYNRYGDQTRTNRNGVARWLELSCELHRLVVSGDCGDVTVVYSLACSSSHSYSFQTISYSKDTS